MRNSDRYLMFNLAVTGWGCLQPIAFNNANSDSRQQLCYLNSSTHYLPEPAAFRIRVFSRQKSLTSRFMTDTNTAQPPSRPNIILRGDKYGTATFIELIGLIDTQVGVVPQSPQSHVSGSSHAIFKTVWIDTFVPSYDPSAALKPENLPLFGKNAKQNLLPRTKSHGGVWGGFILKTGGGSLSHDFQNFHSNQRECAFSNPISDSTTTEDRVSVVNPSTALGQFGLAHRMSLGFFEPPQAAPRFAGEPHCGNTPFHQNGLAAYGFGRVPKNGRSYVPTPIDPQTQR
ncbi:hypothetical protein F5B19DRAFT_492870 [Rostrohypoxylon terebratum]|nr:hypothetical protein F5B19DRAFT_492870 [Rostrohypoxylon terebratum]